MPDQDGIRWSRAVNMMARFADAGWSLRSRDNREDNSQWPRAIVSRPISMRRRLIVAALMGAALACCLTAQGTPR
jgi:hypothetical protein